MADQQQLALLRQRTAQWNTWRNNQPLLRPDLTTADLSGAELRGANLRGADLSGADLSFALLNVADLSGVDLSFAKVGWTIFAALDLRTVKGLETLHHIGPSTIGTDTILRSEGDLPEVFLRQAGLKETFISYVRSLAVQPNQYYTCFISYSSRDQDFAEQVLTDLQRKGVCCWFAPHELIPGTPILEGIDQAIRLYDKLLLILSEQSVKSAWVKREVEAALYQEVSKQTRVLFPLRLDNTVLESTAGWAVRLQHRHIEDFTRWREPDCYQKAFTKLLRDLQPVPSPQEAPE